ncbi:ABC transporter permease [Moheibacter sediminis]|uniref:ABC-2 type transport system permease protein n=1 Tax=Moheibacter sediminis TaxID=1434700 RepID=A0A1W1YEX2_9FLAO|nr:ABC transporter permease [Moheibacter sediminis]SMC34707.1 ABC-2 type transport system permease protein [Moheibacter sediminis]
MHKLLASIKKEILLLVRDWGGLGILFIMPSILLITITLIQQSTFKDANDMVMPIVVVNNDGGEFGETIEKNISETPSLKLIQNWNNQKINESTAQKLVSDGKYQIALVIPENLSDALESRINTNVEKILAEFSMEEIDSSEINSLTERPKEISKIKIFFDPAAGETFRNSVKNDIEKMMSKVESKRIYTVFEEQMGIETEGNIMTENAIQFDEIIAQKGEDGITPNTVQHNVPAWILFGIFFIVVPLGINIVKEKNLGTLIRIRTSPVSYATIISGKIITYMIICLIQFALMLLIARFLFPCLGLIPFKPGAQLFPMTIIVIFSSFAAIGLGILIGTLMKTQEQSAPFGAIFTIIISAIGGIWVPVYLMPAIMQKVAVFSPMNWGITAFYDIILRNGSLMDISIELISLFLFFVATFILSLWINKRNNLI